MTKIIVIVMIFFVIIIVLGSLKLMGESRTVKEKCRPTDFYSIGDKGHRNRIYDCTGVNLEKE